MDATETVIRQSAVLVDIASDREALGVRIAEVLAGLPVSARGPRPVVLNQSLTHDLPLDSCWPWKGRRGRNGYGIAVLPGDRTHGTSAHRLVYQLIFGNVPPETHIDHVCHDPADCVGGSSCSHRICVNPSHLKAVSARENVLRGGGPSSVNAAKTHCLRGHEFTDENTYVDPSGRRTCRTCRTCYRAYDARRRTETA